jgi:hypothetical protein
MGNNRKTITIAPSIYNFAKFILIDFGYASLWYIMIRDT